MKKLILLITVILFVNKYDAKAQAPAGIPYQAVARDNSGNLIASQNITIRFSIIDNTAGGTVLYVETHSPVTNNLGLFTVNIGQGSVVSGTFASVNWAVNAKFLKVELDVTGGSSFVNMGTTQMMSVPYSLYAEKTKPGSAAGNTPYWDGTQWITNGSNLYNNGGNIGIGTTSPEFRLSLDDDGGIMAKGYFGQGATLTATGAGARMIWYPKKGAFRAGMLTSGRETYWDNDSIGNYSFAAGSNTRASGPGSFAGGFNANSSGENSFAYGNNAEARGNYSIAFGVNTHATGDQAMALSSFTTASGMGAIAMGTGSIASGDWSLATGANSTASGELSTVFGVGSIASGPYSTAIGTLVSTNGKYASFVMGDYSTGALMQSSADNQFSARFAGGYRFFSDASTANSYGMFFTNGNLGIGTPSPTAKLDLQGSLKVVDGTQGSGKVLTSDASGNATWQVVNGLLGNGASAGNTPYWNGSQWITNSSNIYNNGSNIGINTTTPEFKLSLGSDGGIMAKGNVGSGATLTTSGAGTRMMWYPAKAAFRVGYVSGSKWDNANIGNYSFASGSNTQANGDVSTAMGNSTTASGIYATAMGSASTASGSISTAMGYSSTAGGYTSTAIGYSTTASGDYSSAFGVMTTASGTGGTAMGYNSTASGNYSSALGNSVSTNTYNGAFVIGDNSTSTIMNAGATNSLSTRFSGGYKLYSNSSLTAGVVLATGGGSWTSVSDRNKKENFTALNNEDILLKVGSLPVSNWNYKAQPVTQRHIGCMAQDFYAAFHLDGESDTTINSLDIDGVNMAAIQALKTRTDELKNAMQKLQQQTDQLGKLQTVIDNLKSSDEDMKNEMQALKAMLEKSGAVHITSETASSSNR